MLPNTITLPLLAAGNGGAQLSLSDTDNGRTVRTYHGDSGEIYRLTISRQTTKENPPVGTDRILLRLEHMKVLESGAERTAFVSVVIASPRNSDFSIDERYPLLKSMIHLLAGSVSPSTGAYDNTLDSAQLDGTYDDPSGKAIDFYWNHLLKGSI